MDWRLLLTWLPWLPSLLLHFVRAGAFFAAMPLFGTQGDSRMLRLVLVVAMASIFWWLGPKHVPVEGGLLGLSLLAVREALIGFAAGFAVSMLTSLLVTAGEVISLEMGFGMVEIMNPLTGKSTVVTSQFFEAIGYLLVLALDLHHDALRVLGAAYELLPVGQPFDASLVYERLRLLIGESIAAGIRYALPVMGVMVLLSAVLVVLARAVPNINLMEFSFGLRILLALLASTWFLAEGTPYLTAVFEQMLAQSRLLFAP